jgi:hypothetical protein
MRIWDISPGYLNRQSLLGEHRELHGIVSIIEKDLKGYSRHPETMRWRGFGWALAQRHSLLAAEMSLRGYTDRSPVCSTENCCNWPEVYIDQPSVQFQILELKYRNKFSGRIPLPKNPSQLWSHHKYSVLARGESLYRKLGKEVAALKSRDGYAELAETLTEMLRHPPLFGDLTNTLQHMWGHVSDLCPSLKSGVEFLSSDKLLKEIQRLAVSGDSRYLISSTALGELSAWMPQVFSEEGAGSLKVMRL